MTKRGRQCASEAQRTKDNILKIASQLFSQNGYDATSLRKIAELANISHGLLRYHFGSKQEIWQAIADLAVERYTEEILQPSLELRAQGVKVALREICRRCVYVTAENPELALILKQESSVESERLDYFFKIYQPIDRVMRELLEQLKEEGTYSTFDTDFLLMTLFGMTGKPFIDACLMEKIMGHSPFSPEYVKNYADQLVRLLFPDD